MNASSNFLLGANHYHHSSQPHYHNQTSLQDSSVREANHGILSGRRAPSVHSLHDDSLSQSTMPTPSISYPRLQQLTAVSPSTLSSSHLDGITHTPIRHVDSCPSRTGPVSTSLGLPAVADISFDEHTTSTYLSRETTALILDKNSNEDGLMKRPVEIRVRCIFLRVGEIDTLNERYTSEVFFEASWYETDLTVELKYDPSMGHFNPQLLVVNHIGDSMKHDKWYSFNKIIGGDLIEVTEHHKIRGVFWERMELNHFPYDVQELSISWTTPLAKDEINFVQNKQKPSGVNRAVFSDQQSWHLYEHVEFEFQEQMEEYSSDYNQIHPVVVCTCHVGRKCGYYIWNAYVLIFLITSASLCTFAIPPSNTHGRLQITCTLLLTSVTFRWVVNKSLPTISYLTALDVYAISSIVALCIINVFHGVISYIYYNQMYAAASQVPLTSNALHLSLYPSASLCRLDRYAFLIFLTSFGFYQMFILVWTFWVPYKRRRAMHNKDLSNRADHVNKLSNESSIIKRQQALKTK